VGGEAYRKDQEEREFETGFNNEMRRKKDQKAVIGLEGGEFSNGGR